MTRVITYGTFDLFHEGHYRLLKRAKELGDYLIVGVTTEKYDMERGKLNVVDSLMTRIENVKKSGFADEVIIEEAVGQKISDVQKYHIDVFAIGSDWMGAFDYISDYCKVVYLERTKNISSTMLREQNRLIQKVGIIGTGRVNKVRVVANKVRDERDEEFLRARIPAQDLLGFIHYSAGVIEADRSGRSPFDYSAQ